MEFLKKYFALVFVLICALVAGLIFLGTSGVDTPVVQEQESVFASVSPVQFAELAAKDAYTVIDIRTSEETAEGKVFADALELDYYAPNFQSELAKLDRDANYLIYCRTGNRTDDTKQIMQSLGFTHVIDLEGGKVAWEQSGRALVVPENLAAEPDIEKPEVVDEEESVRMACPMDARQCPDGSFVGRIGPNCEFAPCA